MDFIEDVILSVKLTISFYLIHFLADYGINKVCGYGKLDDIILAIKEVKL